MVHLRHALSSCFTAARYLRRSSAFLRREGSVSFSVYGTYIAEWRTNDKGRPSEFTTRTTRRQRSNYAIRGR